MNDAMTQTTTANTDPGVILAATGLILLMVLVVYILTSLGLMKFFRAANRPAWEAFVPMYNYYVMNQLAGLPTYWFWLLLASLVLSWLPVFGSLLTMVISIYITYKFLERYGKDAGSTALAVLFPYVYYLVAGSSKDLTYTPAPAAPTAPSSSTDTPPQN